MAETITNGYTDLSTYKLRFYGGDTGDKQDDEVLKKIITAISRLIDRTCHRRFYAVTETRYYTTDDTTRAEIDDLLSVDTLKTDEDGDRVYEITWATTDYDLMPYNAALDDAPYEFIEISPDSDYSFPGTRKGVELKGSFGYSATTPPDIEEACLLVAHRYMKRTSTPLGTSSTTSQGQMQVTIKSLIADPDIMALLDYYKRLAQWQI